MTQPPEERGQTSETRAPTSREPQQTPEEMIDAPDEIENTRPRQTTNEPKWYIFRGHHTATKTPERTSLSRDADSPRSESKPIKLPPPPPWRDFRNNRAYKAHTFQVSEEEIRVVNAALYLRRPLLLTGLPGTGKSSLAYAIADELGLGEVLEWPINSRSQLKDGLYTYDAIGRLQASNMEKLENAGAAPPPIGQFLRLGTLGTAFADSQRNRPRVLLIDEIDKSDIDLPNDLLNVFEEGEFGIPELARLAQVSRKTADVDDRLDPDSQQSVLVRMYRPRDKDSSEMIEIVQGRVRCEEFPIVILTSNGERALPAPFLRRCLRLEIKPPDEKKLQDIVRAHFEVLSEQQPLPEKVVSYIKKVVERRTSPTREYVATDQLLNAIHLILNNVELTSTSATADQTLDRRVIKQLEDFILEAIGTSLV